MSVNPLRVLLIEDNPGDAFLIERSLKEGGLYESSVRVCADLASGLADLSKEPADVVLLDLGLPDSSGFETFEAVRDGSGSAPILILTGLDDEEMGIRAVRSGAQDYLIKGQISTDLLRRSIRYAVERKKAEEENSKILFKLGERVKEQKALYRVSNLLQDCTRDQEAVMDGIVKVLPSGWQFPELARARILSGEKQYMTPGFRQTPWMQEVEFSTITGLRWNITIAYIEKPPVDSDIFLEEERALLTSLSDMLRACCERRHALKSLEWEAGVNARMSELSRALISRMPIEDISSMVLDVAKQFTCSEYGFVGYIDRQTGNLVSTTLTGEIWDKCQVKDKKFVFEHPRGLVGWVLVNKKSILTNSPMQDARSCGTPAGHLPIKRFLSVPALIGNELIGQISLANSVHDYTEKDLMLAERLAVTYALAVRRQQEIDQLIQETTLNSQLLSLAKATANTVDVSRLMEEVALCVKTILKSRAVLSYSWDGKAFKPEHALGLPESRSHMFRAENLKKQAPFLFDACSTGAGSYFVKAEDAGQAPASWIGAGSVLVIPLAGKEGVLGLLVSIFDSAAFDPDDRMRKLLEGIASQVSTALEEARLFKTSFDRTIELSRKMETIQTMHEIDCSILSTLDSREILETSAMLIAKIIPCEKTMMLLVDNEGGGLKYVAGFGTACVAKNSLVKFDDTDAYEVVKTGRPQYAPRLSETKLAPFESILMKDGFLSHIRVPLIVKGETIGVLSCGSRRASAFTYDDLSTLEKLSSQVSVALENSRLLTDIEELFLGTLKALSEAIDAKSSWTHGHSERVTSVSIEIGREMGLSDPELKELEIAGLMHDIGKLGTYESILDKPGRLTEDENKVIRMHPAKGADILSSIKQLKKIIPAIRHHHENYDGGGYPSGLSGEQIPLMARILAVADTVDAMSADRPYRKGKSIDEVAEELKRCCGTQFDPAVVEAAVRLYKAGRLTEALKAA